MQQLLAKACVCSRPGRIELLPALPAEWPQGEIRGILARGRITIDRLAWDRSAGKVHLAVTSGKPQTVALRLGGKSQELQLPEHQTVKLELKW